MNPKKSKQEQSRELSRLIQDFIESGGEVVNVPSGISGNTQNNNLFQASATFDTKKERTPLTDVVKTLEQRKQSKHTSKLNEQRPKLPRKKLIVDDFGDPIRWVWDD